MKYRHALILFIALSTYSCDLWDQADEPKGDYVFIEMKILSYAVEVEGQCVPDVIAEPGTFYQYNIQSEKLEYWQGQDFEVNSSLLMVLGWSQGFRLLAGGGAITSLTPVYHLPDQTKPSIFIEGLDSDNTAQLGIDFKTLSQSIDLPVDSTFTYTLKSIGPGTVQGLFDSCFVEYTDSIVVINYGLNPSSNIIYGPF